MESRTKKKKKNKQSPKDLWDNKHTNMSTGVVPKGQERGKKEKKKKKKNRRNNSKKLPYFDEI